MTLTINNPVGRATLSTATATGITHLSIIGHRHFRQFLPSSIFLSSRTSTSTLIVSATGKFTSRTGKFDSKNRRTSNTTTKDGTSVEEKSNLLKNFEDGADNFVDYVDDGFVMPNLPGAEPDFWEGSKWDAFGFVVQYLWAFGVVFALVACGIAVATYNEGATDFKETSAYKESVQSQDLLEGPEASDTDVFESNPTEEAPALE
ncbi:unnamed protein product [Amaranthus hypochondriacus]